MPTGFSIGPLFIHYYGIILMLGAVAGAWLATREAIRRKQDPEIVWDLLVWLLISGIIGARLWHIFTPPPSMVAAGITTKYYLTHPFRCPCHLARRIRYPRCCACRCFGVVYIQSQKKPQFFLVG